jgi:hypothetical protein
MRIACFYPQSVFCAWCVSTGLVDTLARMGHEVAALPVDATVPGIDASLYPSRLALDGYDGIVISGPEHIHVHLRKLYPEWSRVKTPKVSWMHETVDREDYGRLAIDAIREMADTTFCPAVQDEKYGLKWLPFAADTELFKPDWKQAKTYDFAFIGMVYPKRAEFLRRLTPYLKGLNLRIGNVQVQDLSGVCVRETAALYADNLRRIRIFVNLPTLSQLAVTKVYEVLASGTFLITPAIAEPKNFDNLMAHFYDPNRPDQLAESMRFCLEHAEDREQATRLCCDQVHRTARLEQRCATLIAAMEGHK